MTRRSGGFTLLELMVTVAIAAILGAIIVWSGRSVRKNASLSEGAYQLTLRIAGLRARAMADRRDYVLVVSDADPASLQLCRTDFASCGTWVILHDLTPAFDLATFTPVPPFREAQVSDDGSWDRDWDFLPVGTRLAVGTAWRPQPPFDAVPAWAGGLMRACDGRPCFALRFRSTGEVWPEPRIDPLPAGFAFVLAPIDRDSAARDRRGVFVSFPTGIVKTQAF